MVVSGEYQGWNAEYGSPPVTRSDWVISDETGWIYVSGRYPGLDPVRDKGKELTVVGKVEAKDQVYLKAEKITIGRLK